MGPAARSAGPGPSAGRVAEPAMSKVTSARVLDVLTCWPPGPPDVENRQLSSRASMATPGLTAIRPGASFGRDRVPTTGGPGQGWFRRCPGPGPHPRRPDRVPTTGRPRAGPAPSPAGRLRRPGGPSGRARPSPAGPGSDDRVAPAWPAAFARSTGPPSPPAPLIRRPVPLPTPPAPPDRSPPPAWPSVTPTPGWYHEVPVGLVGRARVRVPSAGLALPAPKTCRRPGAPPSPC